MLIKIGEKIKLRPVLRIYRNRYILQLGVEVNFSPHSTGLEIYLVFWTVIAAINFF